MPKFRPICILGKIVNDFASGSIGIALVGDEVTVKKIIKKDNLLILAAANPKYDDRYFTVTPLSTV